MNLVAIITARGGSKRLLRKNVVPFCGLPLVEWSIIQAKCAHCLTDDDIYVSTDDDEIAGIAERQGVRVIRRPDWPDADQMSAHPVMLHAVAEIERERPFTHHLHLLPTSPCRRPEDIDQVVGEYKRIKREYPDCSRLICVTPKPETLVWKAAGQTVQLAMLDKGIRYLGTGPSTVLYERAWWEKPGNRRGPGRHEGDEVRTWFGRRWINRPIYYTLMEWYQGIDVDNRDTLELNEILFERYILKGRGESVYWDYQEAQDGVDKRDRAIAGRR